jgi:hypothetical protein
MYTSGEGEWCDARTEGRAKDQERHQDAEGRPVCDSRTQRGIGCVTGMQRGKEAIGCEGAEGDMRADTEDGTWGCSM